MPETYWDRRRRKEEEIKHTKKKYHDFSQVDENDYELEDAEEQYEKESDEIENI